MMAEAAGVGPVKQMKVSFRFNKPQSVYTIHTNVPVEYIFMFEEDLPKVGGHRLRYRMVVFSLDSAGGTAADGHSLAPFSLPLTGCISACRNATHRVHKQHPRTQEAPTAVLSRHSCVL